MAIRLFKDVVGLDVYKKWVERSEAPSSISFQIDTYKGRRITIEGVKAYDMRKDVDITSEYSVCEKWGNGVLSRWLSESTVKVEKSGEIIDIVCDCLTLSKSDDRTSFIFEETEKILVRFDPTDPKPYFTETRSDFNGFPSIKELIPHIDEISEFAGGFYSRYVTDINSFVLNSFYNIMNKYRDVVESNPLISEIALYNIICRHRLRNSDGIDTFSSKKKILDYVMIPEEQIEDPLFASANYAIFKNGPIESNHDVMEKLSILKKSNEELANYCLHMLSRNLISTNLVEQVYNFTMFLNGSSRVPSKGYYYNPWEKIVSESTPVEERKEILNLFTEFFMKMAVEAKYTIHEFVSRYDCLRNLGIQVNIETMTRYFKLVNTPKSDKFTELISSDPIKAIKYYA